MNRLENLTLSKYKFSQIYRSNKIPIKIQLQIEFCERYVDLKIYVEIQRAKNPQIWWFFKKTPRTLEIVILMNMIYYSEMIQAKSAKRKDTWGEVWMKSRANLQKSSPSGDTFNPPSKLWQYMWNVVYQRSSLETQCPEFLLGACYVHIFCQVHMQVPNSRRKTSVQHNLYCLYKQFRHSKTLLSVLGMVKTFPRFKFLHSSQGLSLYARLSKDNILRLVLLTLLWTFAKIDK